MRYQYINFIYLPIAIRIISATSTILVFENVWILLNPMPPKYIDERDNILLFTDGRRYMEYIYLAS